MSVCQGAFLFTAVSRPGDHRVPVPPRPVSPPGPAPPSPLPGTAMSRPPQSLPVPGTVMSRPPQSPAGSPGDEEDDPERLPGDREERDGRSEAVKPVQPKNTAAVIARGKELPCVGCVEKADARQLFLPRDDGGSVLRLQLHGLGAAIALFTIAREPLRVIFLIAG
ncbi:hypothetical protein EYF80_058143 [Liparis tanakae]|uniref:Uncharacterized protein n=1 Tax=Liparis tanakae TaxID=230148 RepID=A0A4Z2ESZ3_9TELE|nr:hypothetical protein EYF80_058143 [Liparis tanakae]